MILSVLNVVILRVVSNLRHDEINLLQFEVDNVVHDALRLSNVRTEEFEVEFCLLREWVLHVRVEVHREQAARVVRAEWNLATWVCRNGAETEVGIAVGYALAYDGVPEEYTWFGTLPCVVYYFAPQFLCRDFLLHQRVGAIDRETLCVWFICHCSLHELVIDLHADVGTSHFSFCHFCVDERLAVWMLYAYGEHERTASAVLRHLASRVAIALHEGHEAR